MKSSSIKLVHITTVPQSLWFFVGQIGYMKTKGLTINVISSPGKLLARFSLQQEVTAHAVKMSRQITPLRDLLSVLQIYRLLFRLHPQIVHSHTPKGGLLGMISAWLARVPVRIYHIHGLPLITARSYKRWLLRWSEQVACRLAHQVLCVSPSIREVAIAEQLCPAHKIKVLLNGSINGVEATEKFNPQRYGEIIRQEIREKYGIPPEALVVGFVGRLVRDKGIAELVAAWQTLKPDFPTLHLLIVGEFEPQDPLPTTVVSELHHDAHIHFTGHITDGMPQLYRAMDMVVLPSYREGFPVTALEAAAMELPIVASRIPGCVDAVIDGETGTLVPPYDAIALAEAIRNYLTQPDLRRRHGQIARGRVLTQFRPEDIWRATYQEYMRLLDENDVRAQNLR